MIAVHWKIESKIAGTLKDDLVSVAGSNVNELDLAFEFETTGAIIDTLSMTVTFTPELWVNAEKSAVVGHAMELAESLEAWMEMVAEDTAEVGDTSVCWARVEAALAGLRAAAEDADDA